MAAALLTIAGLRFAWPNGREILRGIDLALAAGECIALAGANGSGKSTLFRCITGLCQFQGGSIHLDGRLIKSERDFQYLRAHVGLCLQNAEDQIIFSEVLEDVSFGPLNLGHSAENAQQMALAALEMLGIADFAGRRTSDLSGGEGRLMAIAGILAMQPRVLLLDEPFTGLDDAACARLLRVLRNLPCARLIADHNRERLRALCAKTARLADGKLEITHN